MWRWQAGAGFGALLEGPANDLMVRAQVGAFHAPLNPVTGLVEFGAEAYVGARGDLPDGGLRAMLQVPYLSQGIGADFNVRTGRIDMLVTMHSPVRRGGLLTRGSRLRLDWFPLLSHSFTLGLSAPIGNRLAGRTRPVRNYVVVSGAFPPRAPRDVDDPALTPLLDSLRVSAEWIRRLVVPFLDQDGRTGQIALARTASYVGELGAHLATRDVDAEVRHFHGFMVRAFSAASGNPEQGRELASRARAILLSEVLLPYDGLVGRNKRRDSLADLNIAARARFSRWVTASEVAANRTDLVLFVFERLTDVLEEIRSRAAREWDDPRLVWLPLQYALLPEDHDEQSELDALVERATSVAFSEGNRLAYVANLGFHEELLRTIRATRAYHVLWIHDFPARTGGRLDWGSFEQVVYGYLAALAERVEAYDSTGTLPSYFIFLDQHYYELRKSRLLMTVLEDPLAASSGISMASESQADSLDRALARLRAAVAGSRALQSERREYGTAWLHNRVKVHVNITNRPDNTFWGGGLISSVFGYPDDVMRDHRKLAFRDVSEDDPFAGEAILTGMGVGEAYLGPGWDDRSLLLRGPLLVELERAARELLLSQGLIETELPFPLRARPPAWRSRPRTAPPDSASFDARAMALVNGTGYLPKPLNVAKAILYSLMPPGSVCKIPDSLWNATFFGSLLAGASLRGGRILVIAPAQANAPSAGFPQMARAHELLTRLLMVRRELGAAIEAAGGDLRVGLYALPLDTSGFASRANRWVSQVAASEFLRRLLPFAPAVMPVVADAGRRPGRVPADPAARVPRLHQKVQFIATGEFWNAVTAAPEWPRFMELYLRYRDATYAAVEESPATRLMPDSLEQIAERLIRPVRAVPRAASYAIVGSQNQDYRGMFMDGEVGVLFTGSQSLVPLIDLVFMAGTVTWIDDQQMLEELLPPPGELRRRVARVAKDGV